MFDIDVEHCECGGKLKLIAAIEEPVVVVRILTHLGLPARAPPRAPARRPELIETGLILASKTAPRPRSARVRASR